MSRPVDQGHRTFVSYIDKSREYYAAHGYERPYQWAYNDEVPFQALTKPLAESRVGLVTTSTLYLDDRPATWPDTRAKEPFALDLEQIPSRMFTDDLSWDKDATHTNDRETFLPIDRLREQVAEGRIGSLAPRVFGVPTDYSQRRTNEADGPAIVQWAREDDIDVVLLIPL
ncbi:MAG: hypothetical protein GY745_15645 [Actinomycetia bacterium]|nr:hypothetical protein [Actinomycetes bacterium]MCP3913729.1 hypothetical protein [Actinomycetes bacterium]MCP4086468.1 hypothetical protein [Actinomycetes bacterium]